MSSRILIIDDDASLRTLIKLALTHVGHAVTVAVDGREGLIRYGDGTHWDLVLLDYRLPGMTGIEVEHEIFSRNPVARVILITGFGTIDMALEAIQAGASDFLRKPFSTDTLRKSVAAVLDRPVERMHAVPLGMACKEFTRTTVNGFSFELSTSSIEDATGDQTYVFEVTAPGAHAVKTRVVLRPFVMELVKAYSDMESVPGGMSFWRALCEEELATYLWQNAAPPPAGVLQIEDVSSSLQRWLDSVLTVSLAEDNAG